MWPEVADQLAALQVELAAARPTAWAAPGTAVGGQAAGLSIGACWVCSPVGVSGRGSPGDPLWCAAAVMRGGRVVARLVRRGTAGAEYRPGLLALRVGALCDTAVSGLDPQPGLVLVDATGCDHPRGAGLALHLGAALGLPSVGVTHRPLLASGSWPADEAGATSPLLLDGVLVGHWLRTRVGTRPLAVHAGWRTDPETAVAVVLAAVRGRRTPEPLRLARQLAREARAQDSRTAPP